MIFLGERVRVAVARSYVKIHGKRFVLKLHAVSE
jgi:hypothetical protein